MDTKSANSARVKALHEFVTMVLSNSKVQDSAHDLDHVLRVWKIGMHLGETEKADLEILEPALLLHDIVRPQTFFGENEPSKKTSKTHHHKAKHNSHAIDSAALSKKILPDFYYKDEEIAKIMHAIETHHTEGGKTIPQTLEAKIVYDADLYDTLGYAGCARAALFAAKEKMTTSEMGAQYLKKIKCMLKGVPFYTKTAVSVSNSRLTVSLDFCKELLGKERFEEQMKR
ncbi:MAG: HD domain-containing protein [Nanoarchaeota archaeon]|nr:HD domain-containing protein [Nanoarchaeota archaeon]MBU4299783.1 HD domain-containing protein [Nanoarchaeota archaeon]MBU4452093.1 HD domain-containing protein [Nanoarchaeota archaeon]MCG2723167.1 HD domain-containing protein [archaeon]